VLRIITKCTAKWPLSSVQVKILEGSPEGLIDWAWFHVCTNTI